MESNSSQLNVPNIRIQDQKSFGLTVDVTLIGYDGQLHLLTLESDMPSFKGLPSLLGDVVIESERLVDAAQRILEQYTGLSNIDLRQLGAFDQVDRHPLKRVITIAFFGIVNLNEQRPSFSKGHRLSWTPVEDITDMAFDHMQITQATLRHIRSNLERYIAEFDVLPPAFALSDLQKLHEVILDEELDKRNFRKRMINQGYIVSTGELQKNVSHRPAELYALSKKKMVKTG